MDGNLGGFKLVRNVSEGSCPECATPHDPKMPHNQQSLFWQYSFREKHGRWPTWNDAMAHCSGEVKELWIKALKEYGIEVS